MADNNNGRESQTGSGRHSDGPFHDARAGSEELPSEMVARRKLELAEEQRELEDARQLASAIMKSNERFDGLDTSDSKKRMEDFWSS